MELARRRRHPLAHQRRSGRAFNGRIGKVRQIESDKVASDVEFHRAVLAAAHDELFERLEVVLEHSTKVTEAAE